MASESESSPRSGLPMRSFLERLVSSRNRDLSLLIPFILGFSIPVSDPDASRVESSDTEANPGEDSGNGADPDDGHSERSSLGESARRERVVLFNSVMEDPDGSRVESGETRVDPGDDSGNRSTPDESSRRRGVLLLNSLFGNSVNRSGQDESTQRERIILINPSTQSMMVMEGTGLDWLLRGMEGKGGQPPASKSSIEAMPRVEIREGDEMGGDCVICLEEFNVGNVIKKMPCEHGFHEKCIEKWLSLHGSCPTCRHKMPFDEEEKESTSGGGGGGGGGEFWVRVTFGGGRRGSNSSGDGGDDRESGLSEPVVVNASESDRMES